MSPVEQETIATLLARREYARAIPLLRADIDKYPTNVRIRLQYADALAGAGKIPEAIEQYDRTAGYYEGNGLTVQAVAVRKKLEKLQKAHPELAPVPEIEELSVAVPKSPLFEGLSHEESEAIVKEMVLEEFAEGDVVLSEGDTGSSLYVVATGEVRVSSHSPKGEPVYLASLGEGDFFGEVSVLTGKPRTATITATQRSELLRLDKKELDKIIEKRPRIREILLQFSKRRAGETAEAIIGSLKGPRSAS